MEATPLPTSDTDTSVEQFDQALATQRDRVREFLAAQQQRLQQVEAALDEQLGLLAKELARSREETHEARDDLQQRSKQLARETETFEAIKAELTVRQSQWEELQRSTSQQQEALAEQYRRQQEELDSRFDELAHQRPEIEAARTQLERDRQTFESNRQEDETRREQVAELQERLQKEQETLSAARQELLASKVDTENQRRRIAREFRSRHAAHLKELDRRQAELDALSYDLESRRSELDTHRDELDRRRKELRESELAEQGELSDQAASAWQRESELTDKLESLRDECRRLREQSAQMSGDEGADSEALARAEVERDALGDRLEEAERRLAKAPSGDVADEDAQQRYDMAMEDVRELKVKNAELQQQLEAAEAGGGVSAPAASGGVLDWEAEKQRILMELDSEFEEDDEEGEPDEEVKAERLKIEKVVERTDRILAEKDREIAELKQLLENQSSSLGSMAVGAAALGEMLDNDEMVQEERENLKRLQEELAEKLRKAEVDISLERAKIGRERAELDEKLRAFEQQGGKMGEAAEGTGRSGAPVRGRWLARLGLDDSDEEKRTP